MKIIFMGTPQFACPALQKLLQNPDFEVVAIYTREPQIAGRGHKLTNSPIHQIALEHNIKVITPKTLRDAQIQKQFCEFEADAAVVVAYGLILPDEILRGTKFGCINLHPSLLPRWRGPSPIQYTLLAGDDEIGVTIIKMDQGIDSGEMILQQKFALKKSDNYGNLAPKLAEIGAEMIVESLQKLFARNAVLTKQNEALATFSKKLKKEESKINFDFDALQVLNKIRALSGSLTAYFEYKNEMIKVFDAEIVADKSDTKIGEIKENFVIKCKKDAIRPLILQRQGKKPTAIDEFLRGLRG